MKYIDAEKLKEEINKRYQEYRTKYRTKGDKYYEGMADSLDYFEQFIDSLHQEQQEKKEVKFVFPKFLYARTTNNKTIDVSYVPQSMDAVEYIRSDSLQQKQPDFPTTDEQVKEFLATHPKIKVPEKYKNPDWLFKKQEQSEVDLEKELQMFLCNYDYEFDDDAPACDIAKHFYELGLKAKEE